MIRPMICSPSQVKVTFLEFRTMSLTFNSASRALMALEIAGWETCSISLAFVKFLQR